MRAQENDGMEDAGMYQVVYNDKEKIRQYGILGEEVRLDNILTDEKQICKLVKILNQESVSEVHIYDVVEDWFGVSVYQELKI